MVRSLIGSVRSRGARRSLSLTPCAGGVQQDDEERDRGGHARLPASAPGEDRTRDEEVHGACARACGSARRTGLTHGAGARRAKRVQPRGRCAAGGVAAAEQTQAVRVVRGCSAPLACDARARHARSWTVAEVLRRERTFEPAAAAAASAVPVAAHHAKAAAAAPSAAPSAAS